MVLHEAWLLVKVRFYAHKVSAQTEDTSFGKLPRQFESP